MIVTDITATSFPPARIVGPADYGASQGTLTPRSSGLHVSQIYRDLERTIMAQKKERRDLTQDELSWYAAGGYLWEHVFSVAMADSFRNAEIVRPGEFMVDGIIGSPDNWDIRTGRVVETKATWLSSRKLDSLEKHFWVWLVQMQGYCRLLDTTEAELYVFFVNGNYAPPMPIGRALTLSWTRAEIDENWEMLKRHARKRKWL